MSLLHVTLEQDPFPFKPQSLSCPSPSLPQALRILQSLARRTCRQTPRTVGRRHCLSPLQGFPRCPGAWESSSLEGITLAHVPSVFTPALPLPQPSNRARTLMPEPTLSLPAGAVSEAPEAWELRARASPGACATKGGQPRGVVRGGEEERRINVQFGSS